MEIRITILKGLRFYYYCFYNFFFAIFAWKNIYINLNGSIRKSEKRHNFIFYCDEFC